MGASAIFMEDQVAPKRCGHMAGKDVIPAERDGGEDQGRGRRAAQQGLLHHRAHRRARRARPRRGAAPRRAVSRRPAPTAFSSKRRRPCKELESVGRAFQGVPQIANMLEGGGQTPVLPPAELKAMGFAMAAYPTTLIFRVARTIERALADIKAGKADRRQRRRELRRVQGHHQLRRMGAHRGRVPARRSGGRHEAARDCVALVLALAVLRAHDASAQTKVRLAVGGQSALYLSAAHGHRAARLLQGRGPRRRNFRSRRRRARAAGADRRQRRRRHRRVRPHHPDAGQGPADRRGGRSSGAFRASCWRWSGRRPRPTQARPISRA